MIVSLAAAMYLITRLDPQDPEALAMRLFEWIDRHLRGIRMILAPIFILFVGGVYVFVYQTGGIKFVYSHSMYFPILLAGFVYGVAGGILVGLLGGIVLGPFMPIDVVTGEVQNTANWLYRTGIFTLIGFFSGTASDSARSYIGHLKWISRHNPSTRLPNQRALFDDLSEAARGKGKPDSHVLAVISAENMLELKSAFGFAVIEEAIRQLASRFERIPGSKRLYHTDTAQIGVLMTMSAPGAEALVAELAEASREPILYNGIPIHLNTRIGTVSFGLVTESPEIYLQRAEAALAMAREKEQGRFAFKPEIITRTEENLTILGGVNEAIKHGQLSLHYQPKIHIPTGDVHGAEALVRWHHPEWGEIPPETFIPRTEQSTLIESITEFALEEAMRQMVRWRQNGLHIPVAVNISTRNLLQPGFTGRILDLLARCNLSGELLELEITEGALMMDMERSIKELSELAGLRIIISIDDFGTGYSSLQYLHKLPISLVKIDQSFVRRVPLDKGANSILEAAMVLAHKMGIKTLAEGVETRDAYEFLKDIGCDMAQGFLISRPLPADDFEKWYRERGGRYLH